MVVIVIEYALGSGSVGGWDEVLDVGGEGGGISRLHMMMMMMMAGRERVVYGVRARYYRYDVI